MHRFTVEVISQTLNPQQVIYAAMHQDYAEEFVAHDRNRWPSEAKCGDIVVRSLLKGGCGHYGPLEHPQIVLNIGWFPHSTIQQGFSEEHARGLIPFDIRQHWVMSAMCDRSCICSICVGKQTPH